MRQSVVYLFRDDDSYIKNCGIGGSSIELSSAWDHDIILTNSSSPQSVKCTETICEDIWIEMQAFCGKRICMLSVKWWQLSWDLDAKSYIQSSKDIHTVWSHLILHQGFTDETNIKFQNILNTFHRLCLVRWYIQYTGIGLQGLMLERQQTILWNCTGVDANDFWSKLVQEMTWCH